MNVKTLYQFFPITKYTLSNLVSKKNWISDPALFNDPFEFCKRPNYNLDETGIKYLKHEETKILNFIHQESRNLGVVCYTECNINNSLMWSIYAEQHHGVCLAFEIDLDNTTIHQVNYSDVLPTLDFSGSEESNRKNLITIATTKSNSWIHEKEWRQVFLNKNQQYEYPSQPKRIYFGCRCPIEDIRIIWNLLIPQYGKDLEFWKGQLNNGTFNLMFSSQPKEQNELNNFPKGW